MKKDNPEVWKDNFGQYFSNGEAISEIALSVYDYLSNWMSREDYPVRPSDKISLVYGIVDEDLDDFVIAVAQANRLVLPGDTSYWMNPVVTVDDLIRFISSSMLGNILSGGGVPSPLIFVLTV